MQIFNLVGVVCFLAGKTNAEGKQEFYRKFAVNTELEQASEIGKKILLKGGNAIDAAIASALAIGVVNSFSSGIGGGGFMLIMKNVKGPYENHFDMIDFREVSPENADFSVYQSNPELSTTSGLSVAIPGEIKGFFEAHKKYGNLPWEDLFTDSIELAKGFAASEILVKKLNKNQKHIFADRGLKDVFTKDGKLINVGDTVSRMNYSKTLKTLSKDPLSFYSGNIAKKIVEFVRKNGGNITESDLSKYQAISRKVIKGSFYNYKIFTTNLPTSGIFIVEALNILERLNIRDLIFMASNDKSYYIYHILIETLKFIISSKEKFGDPGFIEDVNHKISMIISDAYARKIARKFKMDKILTDEEYGFKHTLKEDHGTTHLNIIDPEGNVVSMTTTINLEFGSKLSDPETGIIFNNHMDDFFYPDKSVRANRQYNNVLARRKRPLSSASPMILMGEDDMIVVGGSGGSRITSSLVFFIGYLIAGKNIDESIKLCRIHTQIYPNIILIEPTLSGDVIANLEKLGHKINLSEVNTSFTSLQAIQVVKLEKGQKRIYAVSDYRKNGKSAGE